MESNNNYQRSTASHSEQEQNLEASSIAMQIAAYEESLRNPSGSSQDNASPEPHSTRTDDEASSYRMEIAAYEESLWDVIGSSQHNVSHEPPFMRTNDGIGYPYDGFAHAYPSALSGGRIDQSSAFSFYNEPGITSLFTKDYSLYILLTKIADLPASPPRRPRPRFATLHTVPARQVTYGALLYSSDRTYGIVQVTNLLSRTYSCSFWWSIPL